MGRYVGKRRFKLEQKIGNGAFGEIYAGHDLTTANPVAIKLERKDARYPQLQYEARIYHTFQNDPTAVRIPHMYYFGTEGTYNVLVLDRLGENMEQLRKNLPGGCMNIEQIAMVAVSTLRVLEQFHNKGFVHRDIKPENILQRADVASSTANNNSFTQLYLIDFGLSKYMRNPVTGAHIPSRTGKHLTGTPRYASIGNHRGWEQGRKDDLESLGYVLLYLLHGFLPWQPIDKHSDILEKKQHAHQSGSLFDNSPTIFQHFFQHLNTLNFADRPDYAYLRQLFATYLSE